MQSESILEWRPYPEFRRDVFQSRARGQILETTMSELELLREDAHDVAVEQYADGSRYPLIVQGDDA